MDIDELTALSVSAARIGTLAELFDSGDARGEWLVAEACGIRADFSRQRIDRTLFDEVLGFAARAGLADRLGAMFSGAPVNVTENRAALHVACRAAPTSSPEAGRAHAELEKARALAGRVREGKEVSSAGVGFDAVVNIGIGGSDLGPAMVAAALRRHASGPTVRFVSNVDAADLDAALVDLDPRSTLFVVSSKTFTTAETMTNAARAREWSRAAGGEWASNFVAVTAHESVALDWGVRSDRCLCFFDWVGGRFSVSSVIGFAVMCAIGPDLFTEFLDGMRSMDEHAAGTELSRNVAFLHAMVWFTNTVLHDYGSVAVVPYSHDLARLPAFLQQLVMESNGKSALADGSTAAWNTCPVVWGEPGTNGQHAFFQLLHQGTRVIPVEFIGAVAPLGVDSRAHDLLMANMLAQSEALAAGRSGGEVRTGAGQDSLVIHKRFPGNRPSSVLVLDELSPRTLGALVAMYEHSTAFQGWMVGVNSFDQWGVELGKVVAAQVAEYIASADSPDPPLVMTQPLLDWFKRRR